MSKEIQNKSDAKSKLKSHIKNLPVIKKPYATEEKKLSKLKNYSALNPNTHASKAFSALNIP
jgi:hypothetical protein